MRVTERRTERILNHLQKEHYAEWCSKYGEPGYQDPEKSEIKKIKESIRPLKKLEIPEGLK